MGVAVRELVDVGDEAGGEVGEGVSVADAVMVVLELGLGANEELALTVTVGDGDGVVLAPPELSTVKLRDKSKLMSELLDDRW